MLSHPANERQDQTPERNSQRATGILPHTLTLASPRISAENLLHISPGRSTSAHRTSRQRC